jgi:hypothetical protein
MGRLLGKSKQQIVNLVRGHVSVSLVINHNIGSCVAGSQAIDYFQRKKSVLGSFAIFDAQFLLEIKIDIY